jgi:hypothetical protein
MYKTDYLRFKSETGYIIRATIRFNKFLVISTEFDPFKQILFATDYIRKIPIVKRLNKIQCYDDGTGYLIFEIEKKIVPNIVMLYVEDKFDLYFNKNFKQ